MPIDSLKWVTCHGTKFQRQAGIQVIVGGIFDLNSAKAAHRFRTNSDIAGVERLAVTSPDSAFLEQSYKNLPPLDEDSGPW